MEKIVDEKKFFRNHKEQVTSRAQKDIFFIWVIIMFISVIASHFVLNITGGSPTGFVTATENVGDNLTLLLYAFLAVFIVILITAVMYFGVTQKDHQD